MFSLCMARDGLPGVESERGSKEVWVTKTSHRHKQGIWGKVLDQV